MREVMLVVDHRDDPRLFGIPIDVLEGVRDDAPVRIRRGARNEVCEGARAPLTFRMWLT